MNFSERDGQNESQLSMAVTVDNIRVGFDTEQVIEIFDLTGSQLSEENQEHNVRIDVTPLEQYGTNIEDLSVETTQGTFGRLESGSTVDYNNSVDSVDVTDGIIDLVMRTSEDASDVDPIALKLTGYQFIDVEAVTEIQYDIQSPDDHVEFRRGEITGDRSGSKCGFSRSFDGQFTLVDPQLLPPTLCPNSILINDDRQSSQSLYIEWLTPEADKLSINIDISALDEYATVEEAVVEMLNRQFDPDESSIWGATLENISINDWTVSMELVPDPGTNYAAVAIRIGGINITSENIVDGLSYDMAIEGDADETVETESFDITARADAN